MTEFVIAQHALRTFSVDFEHRMLQPVVIPSADQWAGGVCVAECHPGYGRSTAKKHDVAPDEDCCCGIHGYLFLDLLQKNYPESAQLITVIAAAGTTFIANKGLRTQGARIVAYWSDNPHIRDICREQCEGATCFDDVGDMLAAYDLPRYRPSVKIAPTTLPFPLPAETMSRRLGRILQWIGIV